MERATQPGGRLVSSVRACTRRYSCWIGADLMRASARSLSPFAFGDFPSSLQNWPVRSNLSKSTGILGNLNESVRSRENLEWDWVNLSAFDCDWRELNELEWFWVNLNETEQNLVCEIAWIWMNLSENERICARLWSEWVWIDLNETERIWVRLNESD